MEIRIKFETVNVSIFSIFSIYGKKDREHGK